MRVSKLISPDLRKTLETEPQLLPDALREFHSEDIAELLSEELPERDVMLVIDALPLEMAADVLCRLPEELCLRILEYLGPKESASLLTEMAADDRADLVQELPEQMREEILDRIEEREPGVAEDVRTLAAHGEETAGGIMTTDFLALWPELTVAEAIDEVRTTSRERNLEQVYYIYVVAYDKLIGVLSLRDLILGDADEPISAVMTENIVQVSPGIDQEQVAHTIARYDLTALPVVDAHGHMLGVVTVDDVVDVVIDEATEDAQKMAAVVPIEQSYFQTGFLAFMRSRVTWLVVLFVGELLTTTVMGHYEAQMTALIDLVIFIPLIISSGGNSGSQSSSLIIRALALGEMQPSDWPRVFLRELAMGLSLGIVLGAVGLARVMLGAQVGDPVAMGYTVFFSVICVVTLGTLVGSLMPLGIQRLGLDPAVSSTPFVASLVDVLGLIVYFSVARFILAAAL